MVFVIKCKTCGKISKRNYVNKPKVEKKQEFDKCLQQNHKVEVEKIY